ncbi:MAG: PAS domain S-box protein [Planctomycetota bacterium]|jgi:PAS domain S-box-containing protein
MKKGREQARGVFARLRHIYIWLGGKQDKSKDFSTDGYGHDIKQADSPKFRKKIIPSGLVTKGFALAFLFTIFILSGLVWYTWRSNQQLKVLETRHFRLLQLSGQIIHIDEVLTMSTIMAAQTGQLRWEERYRSFEPQLAAAIKEVIELSPEGFIAASIAQTDAANVKLVAMEKQAFDLVRRGQRQSAIKLLNNPEYQKQKEIYSKGIYEIVDSIDKLEKARLKKEQRLAFTIIVLIIVTMPLIIFIWIAALWILRRYISERNRTELALSMSEQRFRAIADYTYFWEVWVSPAGNPLWTNPAVKRVTGYSAEELLNMRDYPMGIVYKEDRQMAEKGFKSALAGSTNREVQFRLRRKDGKVIWAEMAWQPIFDDKGVSQGHRISIHDISARKCAVEKLADSEKKFRAVAETARSAIVSADSKGNIIYWNRAAEKMFGYRNTEIIGKPLTIIMPERYRHAHLKGLTRIVTTGQSKISGRLVEMAGLRKDGTEFPLELSFSKWNTEEGMFFTSIINDTTERKQAQQALYASEEKFRLMFETSPLGMVLCEMNGTFIEANQAYLDIIGYSHAEMVKLSYWDVTPHGYDADEVEQIRSMEDAGYYGPYEKEYVRKTGDRVPVLLNGVVVKGADGVKRIWSIVEDITERKQAESALRDSEQRYRTLVENIDLGIALVDTDYNILMANSAACRIFECDITEFIGTKCYEEFAKKPEICISCPGQKAMITGQVEEVETERFRDDERRLVVRIQAFPLFDDNRKPTGFIALIEDITKRRQAEEEIKEIQERFSDFFRNAPVGFHIFRSDRIIIDINDAELAMIGYTRDEIVGRKTWADLIIPEQRKTFEEHWNNIITKGEAKNLEYTLVHKEGHLVDVLLSASSRFDEDGNLVNTRGSVLNITDRKRTEVELRKLSKVFTSSTAPTIIEDLQGNIINVNDETVTVYGWSRQELIGQPIKRFLPTDEHDQADALLERCLAGESVRNVECIRCKKDGTSIPVLLTVSILTDEEDNPLGVVSIGQDITERKRAEESLRKSEEFAKASLNATTDMMYLVEPNGKVLTVNNIAAKNIGKASDELIGTNIFDYFPPDIAKHRKEQGARVIRSGKHIRFQDERQGRYFDVSIYPTFNVAGNVDRLAVFVRDITKRKMAEKSIKLHELRLQALLDLNKMTQSSQQEVLDFLLEKIIAVTQSRISFIGLMTEDESTSIMHSWSKEVLAQCSVRGSPIHFPVADAGWWAQAIRKRKPIIVNDYTVEHPAKKGCPKGHSPIHRFMCVPVFEGEHIVAVAAVANKEKNYDKSDTQALTSMMNDAWRLIERKRAQKALTESRESLAEAQRITHIGNWDWNIDQDQLLWSDEMFSIFGLARAEFTASYNDFIDIVHPKDREFVNEQVRLALEGQIPFDCQFHLLLKDGTLKDIEAKGKIFRDENGKPMRMIGTNQDITERRQAEEALRESEERFRTLVENIPGVSYRCACDEHWTMYFISAEIQKLSGYQASDFVNNTVRTYASIIHPQDRQMVKDAVLQSVSSKKTFTIECRIICAKGQIRWVFEKGQGVFDVDGKLLCLDGVIVDITERKQAEEALRSSEMKSRALLEGSPVCNKIIDLDSRLLYMSTAGIRDLKIPDIKPYYGTVFPPQFYPESTRALLKEYLERAKAGEICSVEGPVFDMGGNEVWYHTAFVPACDDQGRIEFVIASSVNITERKQAEKDLFRLNKELEEKNKELESILYAASHDLRSPLVNIQGFGYELSQSCNLLNSALKSKEKLTEMEKAVNTALNKDIPTALNFILESSTKIDSLLSGLLVFCRLGTTPMSAKPIDMNAMMADISRNLEFQINQAGAQIDIEPLEPCLGDSEQINRIFSNLFNNALKFLDKSRPGRIHIYGTKKNGQSIYCVQDNGIGIAQEHREKIFEIFYQLEPEAGKGDGLGLTIVKRIIDRHNGKIWVESEPGKGSKFFVSLPTAWV